MTSSPSSKRFCQTYSQESLTPPPAADLSDTALIFRLYREKECLKATPYCYRADSLHNHARTPDGSVEQQPSNIIYLQTVSAERDVFVPHNRDNNSKFQQKRLIICWKTGRQKGNYLCTVLTQTLRAGRNWKLWKLVTDGSAAGLCYTRATGGKRKTCG